MRGRRVIYEYMKRFLDVVLSAALLILLLFPMFLIAVAIRCDSAGGALFIQVRLGRDLRPFRICKFRTMRLTAPHDCPSRALVGDRRAEALTRVGRFLRRTSLDELPQLWNVLRGEMSLVGPRPERPFFVAKFKEEIPRYMIKHQVRPGMTGWAQINGYRGDTSIRKRIEHDLYYIENWRLTLDIRILILTIFKGFISPNAY